MTARGRVVLTLAGLAIALALPAAASAHAYLTATVPTPSGILNAPPPDVRLTFDEAVEPRFAIISVTDPAGRQQTTGPVHRSATNPDTLMVPLRPHLPEGWYLIFWRAISVDGHPVQGAFTFAVGPNPGPAPQFVIPHISQTATTPRLVVARWSVFLAVMIAIGLFVLRMAIVRPAVRRVDGTRLRALSIAVVAATVLGLVAIPVYLDLATASFSLRSAFELGVLVPLFRTTAFGRGYVDLEICFALFSVAAWIALWVDRPQREQRSIAELLATLGTFLGAAATLLIPGLSGHAAQTAPRWLSVLLDWLHLVAGSIWVGGLVGLIVLWFSLSAERRVAVLSIVVPRFSAVALVSVLLLIATGTGATIIHMPLLSALWTTSYGKTILVKIALLLVAMLLASFNLLRTRPRLAAAREDEAAAGAAARLLRWLVSGEILLVVSAILAAAILSSLAPPAAALAKEGSALAHVGPGKVAETVHKNGYTMKVLVDPNRAALPNSFALQLTKNGKPVTGADVTLEFSMLDMQLANQEYQLKETSPGIYEPPHLLPALVMVGHWGLTFNVAPPGGPPFEAIVVDHATG